MSTSRPRPVPSAVELAIAEHDGTRSTWQLPCCVITDELVHLREEYEALREAARRYTHDVRSCHSTAESGRRLDELLGDEQ